TFSEAIPYGRKPTSHWFIGRLVPLAIRGNGLGAISSRMVFVKVSDPILGTF
ncbi:hypothetical protein HAX54_050941, partial [Datura stramonium]|nr:hypothetical protein [Datura stramonium]